MSIWYVTRQMSKGPNLLLGINKDWQKEPLHQHTDAKCYFKDSEKSEIILEQSEIILEWADNTLREIFHPVQVCDQCFKRKPQKKIQKIKFIDI